MRPALLNLETQEELRADIVLDEFIDRQLNDWRHAPGSKATAGFVRAGPRQLQMTLGFTSDGTSGKEPTDVRLRLKPLRSMLRSGKPGESPPRCLFTWGEYTLPVVVDSAEERLGRCVEAGFPTRASVTLKLTEAQESPKLSLASMKLDQPIRALQASLGAVRSAVNLARNEANRHLKAVKAEIDRVHNTVKTEVDQVARDVNQAAVEVKRKIEDVEKEGKAVANQVVNELHAAETAVKQTMEDAEQQVKDSAKQVENEGKKAVNTLHEKTDSLTYGFKDQYNRMKNEVQGLVTHIKNSVDEQIKIIRNEINILLLSCKNEVKTKLNEVCAWTESFQRHLFDLQREAEAKLNAELQNLNDCIEQAEQQGDELARDIEAQLKKQSKKLEALLTNYANQFKEQVEYASNFYQINVIEVDAVRKTTDFASTVSSELNKAKKSLTGIFVASMNEADNAEQQLKDGAQAKQAAATLVVDMKSNLDRAKTQTLQQLGGLAKTQPLGRRLLTARNISSLLPR